MCDMRVRLLLLLFISVTHNHSDRKVQFPTSATICKICALSSAVVVNRITLIFVLFYLYGILPLGGRIPSLKATDLTTCDHCGSRRLKPAKSDLFPYFTLLFVF